jgi:hypothetical protein
MRKEARADNQKRAGNYIGDFFCQFGKSKSTIGA